MAAATLDMREVRKSQRRHAALLSGVYPFGHPLLKRSKIIWNMENQLAPKFLSKTKGRKAKECVNLDCYGVSTINACAQTEGADYKASNDFDKDTSSQSGDKLKTGLEDLLNSRKPKSTSESLTLERTPSQLSSTTSPEWEEDESTIISRQESSKKSTLISSTTSVATNTATSTATMLSETRSGIRNSQGNSALESSTRINFTADSTTSNTFHLLPADWPGYMTRGFKFSYFQYYSK